MISVQSRVKPAPRSRGWMSTGGTVIAHGDLEFSIYDPPRVLVAWDTGTLTWEHVRDLEHVREHEAARGILL